MQQNLEPRVRDYTKRNKRRSIWKKVVSGLGCVVVFCTTYALILPAITMENAVCGLEEHIHNMDCYERVDSGVVDMPEELLCNLDTLGCHVHTEDCYGADGNIICGYADFVVHTHNEFCYDGAGNLVCELPEIEEHVHTDSCYTTVQNVAASSHVHTDDCYTYERSTLICTEAEAEGHIHDASCYPEGAVADAEGLIDEESQSTVENAAPICGLMEVEGHKHDDSCYMQIQVLTCGYDNGEAATSETQVICSKPEVKLHSHTDECYEVIEDAEGQETKVLTCTETVVLEHVHTEACMVVNETSNDPVLTCSLPEDESHKHTDLCYGTWKLVCGLEEHEHNEECMPQKETVQETNIEDTKNEETNNIEATESESDIGENETETEVSGEQTEVETETEDSSEAVETEAESGLSNAESEAESETQTETELLTEESESETQTETELLTEESESETAAAADVETAEIWESTFSGVELTGDWPTDVVAIAKTQLGYAESTTNYIVGEDGETTYGYTRYGAWYGNPYGDWCAMFVSFCLNYAEVQGVPYEEACEKWITALSEESCNLYRAAADYEPAFGDLVFFDQSEELAGADHVGIVAKVTPAAETESAQITVIEGNSSDMVQSVIYTVDDPRILGYADMNAAQAKYDSQPADTYTAQVTGEDYTITVTYSDMAQIPEGVQLTATEILPDDERYESYLSQIKEELNITADTSQTSDSLIDESSDAVMAAEVSETAVSGTLAAYSLPLEEEADLVDEVEAEESAQESEREGAEETEPYTGLKYFRVFDIAFEAEGETVTPKEVVEVKVELADTTTYDYGWETTQFESNGAVTTADLSEDVTDAGTTTLTYSTENLSDTVVYSNFSEEDLARVQAVIDMIDALPSSEEVEEVLAEYENLNDMEAYEEYYTYVGQEARRAYARYEELGEELQPLVTNIDKLMDLAWLWSAMPLIDEITSAKPTTVEAASTSEFIDLNLYDYGSNINENYNSNKKYPGFQWNGGAYVYKLTSSGYVDRNVIDNIDFGNSMITDFSYVSSSSGTNGKSSNSQDITVSGTGINGIDNNTTYGVTNRPIGLSTGIEVLSRTLGSDGYPALTDGTSLSDLFSDGTYATKKNTASIDGLFQQNATSGEYSYNSRENHAQYSSNRFTLYNQIITPNFITYPFGNFLPLNDITNSSNATQVGKITSMSTYVQKVINDLVYASDYNSNATKQQLVDMLAMYRTNVQGYGINGKTWSTFNAKDAIIDYFCGDKTGDNPSNNTSLITDTLLNSMYNIDWDVKTNFFFGMDMSMNFMQPKGGMTGNDTNKDGKPDYPMVFYFTGDDDVWVYIDGVLFLDLSGIHRHVGGKIDFVKGEVHYYYLDTAKNGDVSTTPYKTYTFNEILSAAGKSTDGLNTNGTFKDYTTHQFKFFYMERGSGSSVCRLNFNFPLLRQNTISVSKEVTADAEIAALGNPDYKFQVLKADSSGNKKPDLFIGAGTNYTIYDENDNMISTGTTDANGVITLKAGQRAEFTGIQENAGKYYVRELLDDITLPQYGQIEVSGESATKVGNVTVGSDKFQGVDSPVKDMSDGSTSFRFENQYTTAKLGKLEISKVVEEYQQTRDIKSFEVSVSLDGELLPVGTKYIVGENTEKTVKTAGIVVIPAGSKVTIFNILAGTSFTVQETSNSALGYTVSYGNAQGEENEDVIVNGNSSASGIIKTEVSIGIIVTNTEKGDSVELPVIKTIPNPDGQERQFNFKLVQVKDEKGTALGNADVQQDLPLTITDSADGKFVLNYLAKDMTTLPVDYYYKMIEKSDSDSTIDYDKTIYVVKVTVKESDSVEGIDSIEAKITGIWKDGVVVDINNLKELSFDFTNILLRDLTLTKDLAGIESTSDYTFEVSFSALEGVSVPDGFTAKVSDGTKITFDDGKATANIELKADESVTIFGLPYGVTWTITEKNTDGYHVSWKTEDSSGNTIAIKEGTSDTGTLDQSLKIVCTNAASYELPETGGTGTTPYTLAGLALLTCAAYLWCIKAKRGKEGSA